MRYSSYLTGMMQAAMLGGKQAIQTVHGGGLVSCSDQLTSTAVVVLGGGRAMVLSVIMRILEVFSQYGMAWHGMAQVLVCVCVCVPRCVCSCV